MTLLYAGLFTVCALVLYGVTYWFATDYAARDETNEIAEEFAAIQDDLNLVGEEFLPRIIQNHLRERMDVRAVYLLEDKEGRKIAGNVDAMMPATVGPTVLSLPVDGAVRDVRAVWYTLNNGDYLLVGQDTSVLREMKAVIARAFSVGLLITFVLAVGGSAAISTATLKRVEAVSRTARAIIGGNLSQRVPLRGTHDEFDDLSESVNAMLDRIEDLMRSIRQVSTDIAHDLRTPLTRLRQQLERVGRLKLSEAEFQDAIGGCLMQVGAILETFSALLRIAQIEAGRAAPMKPIDITRLLAGIVEDFAPAAEDHGQRLVAEIETGLSVPGDRELLTQMVVNLVDNAIRHSSLGAEICVHAKASGAGVELAVADTGPGIPTAEYENVLRPFYRLEASRTTEGSGLGLSLVAAIAKCHNASLSLADNTPGLRVSVLLPMPA